MATKIALAGNPNSGKTTMFNDLTGSSQYVGNWPGVTVEKKEGKLRGNREVVIQDLPGIYSLSPYTLEEVVSRNYLIKEQPDAIINIVDATNIERNLYLTTQLTEIGVPVVMALNMIDIIRKNGDVIDLKKLGDALGCEVVETSALKGTGSQEVVQKAIALAGKKTAPRHTFSPEVETALETIGGLLQGEQNAAVNLRWFSIKVFERDQQALKELSLAPAVQEQIEAVIDACEEALDDDSESIITNERYNYITGVVKQCVQIKNRTKLSTSDKIDRIVTNRVLALPIFVVVMFLVYFISISTVGTAMTDWVNESLFEDGWHVLGIGAGDYEEAAEEFAIQQEVIGAFLEEAEESGIEEAALLVELLEAEPEEYGGEQAYETLFDATLDSIVQNPVAAAIATEAEIMDEDHEITDVLPVTLADFAAALEVEEPDPAEFGPFVPGIMEAAQSGLESIDTADWLVGLVVEGILAGVGAVLGFLPQMLVLFLCLAILEDCGYMARIAFIMDRIFRKFGLSGKSFIPILIGTGCAVPGIMASRTIENESDRRMTIITTSFIPCGAKLPIIALIAGAIFGGAAWIATSAYFIGLAAIIISGIILKKFKAFAGDPAPFVMELPAYHAPGVKGVLIHMWDRGKAFVKKAGTIILLATILVWFLSSFSFSMEMVEADGSMLAAIGGVVAPVFAPLGWGDWRAAVATFTGLIAKENVVGTFAVLFGFGEVMEDGYEIWGTLRAAFTPLAAYSFLLFNLLCAPCFAAIGAVRREMMSAKWTLFAIGYQTLLAYVVSFIVYQLGLSFTQGFRFGAVIAVGLIGVILYLLLRKPYSPDDDIKAARPQKVSV